ncbi:hypothetical protein ABKN59_011533 [Abortiporus biennis]
MSLKFHSFQDKTEWPESVQRLVGLLKRPLPSSQELASLPSLSHLSHLSHSQLQRIPDATKLITLEVSKLSTTANLTLMTSAAIEQSLTRNIGPSRTIHHWFTLIRALAHATCENADAFGDVSVVYPTGFGVECGVASMLVTFQADQSSLSSYFQHSSEPKDAPSNENNIAFDERDSHGDSIECGEVNDDDDKYDDYEQYPTENSSENVSETTEEFNNRIFSAVPQLHCPSLPGVFLESELAGDEPSDEPFIDLPLSGHILPGRCNWPSVPFPVLCVASDNIIPLVASAAYQRWAWNIDLPVVGFQMSEYGSLVHTYIAWITSTSDHQHTPTVHVLCPDSIVGNPSCSLPQGVFDLSDPPSSLKFSQFILSFDHQFNFLRNNLPSRQLANVHWRSDDDAIPWSADIERWRVATGVFNNSGLTNPYSSYSIPPPPLHGSDFTAHSTMVPSTPSKIVSKHPGGRHLNEGSVVGSSQQHEDECSAVYDRSSGPIDGAATIASLMLNRFAFSVARVSDWTERPSDPPEFCKMLEEYEETTCFLWPSEWRNLKDMPTATSDLISERHVKVLFRQYNEMDSSKVQTLNPEFTNIMAEMLPFLVNGSYITDACTTSTREAECRHYFDSLFNNFYHRDQVFFEAEIRLPQNTLLQQLKSPGGDEVLQDLHEKCQQWSKHTSAVFNHVSANRKKYHSEFPSQCNQTATFAETLRGQAFNLSEAEAFTARSKLAKQNEPTRATCDAFLACAVEISRDDAKKCRDAYNASRLAALNFGPASASKTKPSSEPKDNENSDPSTTESRNDDTTSPSAEPLYEFPFRNHSGDYAANTPRDLSLPPSPTSTSMSTAIVILLPVLMAAYGNPSCNESEATNQGRLHCIAAVRYLASIGIKDYPVYVLVTHGTIAGLTMAWYSTTNNNTYIMERNVRKFDITVPIQAFHLATVIMRLKVKGDELKERVANDQDILNNIFREDGKEWAMGDDEENTEPAVLPTAHERDRIADLPEQ